MTVIQSIILGVVQGATEFLPISSSGHLVIVPFILGWDIPKDEAYVFNVLVQVATLVAVFAYFWREIWLIFCAVLSALRNRKPFESSLARLGWLLILSTFPAVVLGLILKESVARAFDSALSSAFALLVTAALLVAAERVGKRQRRLKNLTWVDSLVIGFFQVLALFPGVSRSGATITGGMVRDLKRPSAARFAFLMSIPIMIAAGILTGFDLLALPNTLSIIPTYIPGFITAAVVGYLAIRWLIKYLTSHSLYVFAIYCTVLSVITVILLVVKG